MSFSCLNPFLAVCLYKDADNKQHLKFIGGRVDSNIRMLQAKYGTNNVYTLPCGKCEPCRINYAEEWSIRCTLESYYHKYNYFITLTYDDVSLKKACHHDFKRFIEKLQGTHHENKVAYFACEELGEVTGRLHYHLILFLDYELDLYNPVLLNGFLHYHSKKISESWVHGLHDVARFENSCAKYVAKYMNKKESKVYMSRNIGKQYFYDHYHEIVADNFKLYGDFGHSKKHVDIPRSMFYWFKDVDCPEVDSWIDIKKGIAQSVSFSKARDLHCVNPEEVLEENKSIFNNQKERFKVKKL